MNKDYLVIKDQMVSELESLTKNTVKESEIDFDGDEADKIQATFIAAIHSELSMKRLARVNELNHALAKFSNGDYGACEECDEDISIKRLNFNPCFRLCIGCAEASEKVRR